jgi:CheY-like chemotaxis protein
MATEDYSHLKLLFVDDAPHTRLLLREITRGSCWKNAEFVDNAFAAFEMIQTSRPDLVITDWQMPGRNGLELIHDIRQRPDSPDPLLPVILLTASGDAGPRDGCTRRRGNRFSAQANLHWPYHGSGRQCGYKTAALYYFAWI